MLKELLIVLEIIVGFIILNSVFLFFYCRIESAVDKMLDRQGPCGPEKSNDLNSPGHDRSALKLLKETYKYLDHYFYGWMRYWIIKTGHIPSNRIRKFVYKYIFALHLSKGTAISGGCEIRSPWNISLGKCIVQSNCILDGRSGLIIEDNAVLGTGVHIWTQEHDINSPDFAVTPAHKGAVVIRSHTWVCSDSTILPGIEINEGAVVASKACVTKDCEPFTIYGGVPAKKIGERRRDLSYQLSGKPHWHFY